MIRKTFNTKPEATKYQNDLTEQGHIAILGVLGDKFRVYVETKEETEKMKTWRRDNWNEGATERYLRRIAWREGDAVEDAIALKRALEDGTLYSDYETVIEIARIMEKLGGLKTAGDVFHFIDDTHHYDKAMKQIITESLEEYDYEAKEEVAKE